MKRKWWLVLLLMILILLAGGILLYTADFYHADPVALETLNSADGVAITPTDYGWFFDGPSEEKAMIFYPGGKVEETAYAPLLRQLAAEGMDACLVRMPLHLALLGIQKADTVMAEHRYEHWYIGGHSLGGVSSTFYAAKNSEKLDGVILLAAYPVKQLNNRLKTVMIYGSEDKVLNMVKFAEYRVLAPTDAVVTCITGGNHSQFGSYGIQKGDGIAQITPEEQIRKTVESIRKEIID